jgi:hypothetical protein
MSSLGLPAALICWERTVLLFLRLLVPESNHGAVGMFCFDERAFVTAALSHIAYLCQHFFLNR